MIDSHDHGGGGHHGHADWLGGAIAFTKYASGKGNIRAAWWSTPIGFGLGLLAAYLVWAWGSPIDPLLSGAAVAFVSVFLAPYVHFWSWNAITRMRKPHPSSGDRPHGTDTAADRTAHPGRR